MNHYQKDEMNYSQFYVIEDEGPRKCRLSLWRNDKNKLVIEICDNDEPDDMYMQQCMVMGVDDALALYQELQSILQDMETVKSEGLRVLSTIDKTTRNQPLSNLTNPIDPSDGDPIPAWRQKEKQQQLKLITA